MFDAYLTWLGIPATQRPPTYYQLLGIPPSEFNNEAIEAAALRRMTSVRAHQNGPQAAECRRLLQEIMKARDTLIDPQRRRLYDAASPDALPWDAAIASPKPSTAPPTSPDSASSGDSPWWAAADPADPIAGASTGRAPRSAPVTGGPRMSGPSMPAQPHPADSTRSTAGQPWWKQVSEGETAPAPAPPTDPPNPPRGSVPPPLYEPLGPDVYLDPGPAPAPAPLRPAVSAIPAPPVNEFAALSGPTRRRQKGGGALVGFAAIVLLGAGGVAYFVFNKEKVVQPSASEIVQRPSDKHEQVAEVVREASSTKVAPKRETVAAVKKETTRPVDPVKLPKKDPPREPKAPSPSPPDDLSKPKQYKGHESGVLGIAVAPDGQTFISIGEDRRVLQWPVGADEGSRLYEFANPGVAVTFLPGKQEVACCDGGSLVVLDVAANAARKKMTNPRGSLSCLAPDADGTHVLTGGTDGTLRWWDTVAQQKQARAFDASEAAVTAVTVSHDGKLAAGGTADGFITTWNLVMGKPVKKWKAHAGAVNGLAFDPDGKRLLSVGADRSGAVWGFDSGKIQAKLGAFDGVPLAVAWTGDGKRVLTAGIDRSVRLWDATSGKAVGSAGMAAGKVYALAVDPGDRFVLAATAEGVVNRFPLPPGR